MRTTLLDWAISAAVVSGILSVQAIVAHQESRVAEHELSANISGAVMQCLPETVYDVCAITLTQKGEKLQLVAERHSVKHYGQAPDAHRLKYVVAVGD